MPAHEHIGPQFNNILFHGSSDRFGRLKKGDMIVSSYELGVDQHHEPRSYPDAPYFAHATTDPETAAIYANWAATGEHTNKKLHGEANPVIYTVSPNKNQYLDPEEDNSIRSVEGFKVIGTYEDPKLLPEWLKD